jgi:hypothetical protein
MTFFEKELRKIAAECEYIQSPKYVGKVCMFRLNSEVTGKLEFITKGYADHYSALKLSLFNRNNGLIDCQVIDHGDIMGFKEIYTNICSPYIWKDDQKADWYGYRPTESDYRAMSRAVDDYLSCFADPIEDLAEYLSMGGPA